MKTKWCQFFKNLNALKILEVLIFFVNSAILRSHKKLQVIEERISEKVSQKLNLLILNQKVLGGNIERRELEIFSRG